MHRLSAYVIVHRTQSDQTPNAIRSDTGRKPIGWRTESDRTADGNRLDGGRNPIRRRTETIGGAAVSARLCRLPEQELHQPSNKANATNVGGYGILAVVTLPSAVIFFHR